MIYWDEYKFDDFEGVEEALALANRRDNMFCVFVNVETQSVWADLKIGDVWPVYTDYEIVCVHYNYPHGRFTSITEEELLCKLTEAVCGYINQILN